MKRGIILMILFGIFCTVPAWAQVSVKFPKDYDIKAVNGKKYKGRSNTITLPNGANQVVFQVIKDVDQSFDADLEYSDVFVVTFTAQDTQLHCNDPVIRSAMSMRAFNNNPRLEFKDANDISIPIKKDKLVKEGFQLMRDYEKELVDFNRSSSPAALASLSPSDVQTAVKSDNPVAATKPESPAPASVPGVSPAAQEQKVAKQPLTGEEMDKKRSLEMLRYWYDQADEKTKKEFLKKEFWRLMED